MPKHTRVGRCVQKLKPKHGKGAYAICQKAKRAPTKQSYKTGRSLNAARKRGRKKPK